MQNNRIPITIEYRCVKNINLYIKPPDGHILITAPKGISKKRIYKFLEEKSDWIEKVKTRMERAQAESERQEERPITREELKELEKDICRIAAKWEPVMGVHASHFTIRTMKTRWGSCTPATGRIRINAKLSRYPEEELEYIIVHELCHLLEPSHGQRFKDYMTKFLPDWRERRRKLHPKI